MGALRRKWIVELGKNPNWRGDGTAVSICLTIGYISRTCRLMVFTACHIVGIHYTDTHSDTHTHTLSFAHKGGRAERGDNKSHWFSLKGEGRILICRAAGGMSSMYFKYVLSASEIFITLEMQLVHSPGVYIVFFFFFFPLCSCWGNKWANGGKGGIIKNTSLSGLAKTDLLRAAVVCTVVGTLVWGADHSGNVTGEIGFYKLEGYK